jgi:hypothetical protein
VCSMLLIQNQKQKCRSKLRADAESFELMQMSFELLLL